MVGRCSAFFSSNRRPSLPYSPSAGHDHKPDFAQETDGAEAGPECRAKSQEDGMRAGTSSGSLHWGPMRLGAGRKLALVVGPEAERSGPLGLLAELGWETETAEEGREAAKQLLFHPFNLVLFCLGRGEETRRAGARALVGELERGGGKEWVALAGLLERKAAAGAVEELRQLGVGRVWRSRQLHELRDFAELLEGQVLGGQRKVRAADALFAAVDNAPVPVEITDSDKKVEYVNAAYEAVTGCLRSDVVGTFSSDLRRKSLPPADAAAPPSSSHHWRCLPVVSQHSLSNRTDHFVFIRGWKPGKDAEEGGRRHTMDVRRSKDSLGSTSGGGWTSAEALAVLQALAEENPSDPRYAEPIAQLVALLAAAQPHGLGQPRPQLRREDKVSAAYLDGLVRNGPSNGPAVAPKDRKMSLSDAMRHNSRSSFPSIGSSSRSSATFSPDLRSALARQDDWDMDVLALERLSHQRPLSTLGAGILRKWGVEEFLGCSEARLGAWLAAVEGAYHTQNPYHNATHAADVLHATAFWLDKGPVGAALELSDAVALLLAAIVHDLDHPGRTSAFLINTRHPLAVLYNDISVLESHHSAAAFQLSLSDARLNIFAALPRPDFASLRSAIVQVVLATDMSKHFQITGAFHQTSLPAPSMSSPESRLSICRLLIKCADISNPLRPWGTCREWAWRILEEYFRQTAEEAAKGLPLTMPVFHRPTCNVPQTQCTFIDMFARQMFQDFTAFAGTEELLENLEANYARWKAAAETWPGSAAELGVPASLQASSTEPLQPIPSSPTATLHPTPHLLPSPSPRLASPDLDAQS